MVKRAQMVDRGFVRMVSIKRMLTGSMALAAGVGLMLLTAARGSAFNPRVAFALTIFFGGGAWALYDGVRLHRELRR